MLQNWPEPLTMNLPAELPEELPEDIYQKVRLCILKNTVKIYKFGCNISDEAVYTSYEAMNNMKIDKLISYLNVTLSHCVQETLFIRPREEDAIKKVANIHRSVIESEHDNETTEDLDIRKRFELKLSKH